MNQAALDMLASIFGNLPPEARNPDPMDIPSSVCRDNLADFTEALSIFTAIVLRGSESKKDTSECVARTVGFVKLRVNESHNDVGLPANTSMDWPDVKREFVAILEAVLEAVKTGHQVVKPVPRSAEAIKLFGLDKPKPQADFLKPQMVDARAFVKGQLRHDVVPPPVHGEAEAKAEQTIAKAFAKPPHGGYPSMGQTVAEGRPETDFDAKAYEADREAQRIGTTVK